MISGSPISGAPISGEPLPSSAPVVAWFPFRKAALDSFESAAPVDRRRTIPASLLIHNAWRPFRRVGLDAPDLLESPSLPRRNPGALFPAAVVVPQWLPFRRPVERPVADFQDAPARLRLNASLLKNSVVQNCECLFFGGAGYVDAGSNASLRFTNTGLTISFWIKLTQNNTVDGMRVISTLGPSNLNGFDVFVGTGAGGSINQLWFQMGNNPNFYFASAGALTPGVWYYITCLYNNVNTMEVLVNTAVQGSNATSANDLGAGTGNCQIGNFQFTTGLVLNNAEILDMRVYAYCFNSTEVAAVYNSGCPNFSDVTTGYSSLKGWWKFNEGGGTTAADSSGNGNTGTLTGSPLPVWTSDCPCPPIPVVPAWQPLGRIGQLPPFFFYSPPEYPPPKRAYPVGLYPSVGRAKLPNLVTWNPQASQTKVMDGKKSLLTTANERDRRHQQMVATILNSLLLQGDLAQLSQVLYRLGYTPDIPGDWAGASPSTVADALDRIAAALANLGQKP